MNQGRSLCSLRPPGAYSIGKAEGATGIAPFPSMLCVFHRPLAWEKRAAPSGETRERFPFVGYASARDMKKYVGELRDFIPGTSGYAAYWVQNEIKIYSDVKARMKRKFK